MNWTLQFTDVPKNPDFPIIGRQEIAPGVKGPEQYFSLEQVIRVLSNITEMPESEPNLREEMIISPILPEGTLLYSSHPNGNLEQIVFEIPQKSFDIRYRDEDEFFSLAFPRMIFMCELKGMGNQKLIDTMRIYAVENNKEPITPETPLYDFPYPNVMKGSGTVCWGINERLLVDSLLEAKKAVLLFFSAPFNEDHGVRTTLGINTFRKLLNELDEQPYSDDWLVPARKTLEQVLRETDY